MTADEVLDQVLPRVADPLERERLRKIAGHYCAQGPSVDGQGRPVWFWFDDAGVAHGDPTGAAIVCCEHPPLSRIALDELPGYRVSTRFLCTPPVEDWANEGAAWAPRMFETAVFNGGTLFASWRYATKGAAERGHATIVRALREGRPPDELLELELPA